MAPAAYPCLKCEKQVAKNAKAVKCSLCSLYIHISCTSEISDEVYNFMKTQESSGFKWFCQACRNVSAKFSSDMAVLNARIDKVQDEVTTNKNNICENKNNIENLNADINKCKEELQNNSNDCKNEIFVELQERERRKNNIIIHNLPEPNAEIKDGKERKEVDKEKVTMLLSTLEESFDFESDVKYMFRIGEKSDKDRPVTISFKKNERKDDFVSKSHKLADSNYQQVSISTDLTKRQRKEQKDLETEAAQKNESLSREDFLKFEWIVVGPRGNKRIVKVPRDRAKARKRTYEEAIEDGLNGRNSQRARTDLT